MLRHTVA